MPFSMPDLTIAGWDIGGAHLKIATVAGRRLKMVSQIPCPLWQGIECLNAAVTEAHARIGEVSLNAVTMTGEMTDLFKNREEGVHRLVESATRLLPGGEILIYAGTAGFLAPDRAVLCSDRVASANWMASATFAASTCPEGLFIDIGSTTTDFVAFRDGQVWAQGFTDQERLVAGELVYTGVSRTPVFAIADRVPHQGQDHPLIPELFATMADVYRLCGALPEDADQLPATDGEGKSDGDSARRLARMIGCDVESAAIGAWRKIAGHLADAHHRRLAAAAQRLLAERGLDRSAPLLGAGVGRFLVRKLARDFGRDYVDFGDIVDAADGAREWAARCAPAAAVALLAAAR
jgi:(4-(4-[2-(gamma-L-glutamylamino)ethyl]phenoxymethyl)furan-2-yl)methanamine synthase